LPAAFSARIFADILRISFNICKYKKFSRILECHSLYPPVLCVPCPSHEEYSAHSVVESAIRHHLCEKCRKVGHGMLKEEGEIQSIIFRKLDNDTLNNNFIDPLNLLLNSLFIFM
jgi:hypothetical protein